MENPEEILHSLEEFSKLRPKDIPRELEEYLCFVAKTGDPVYQWSAVKSLFREKLLNVMTEFYESCPSIEIPQCPNVEMFNYDTMKNFILERIDTFPAAPFTVQRICELLTTPRKEYNRIDKYMRALEKNILVVSMTEPGNRRSAENGEGIMNGIESEHIIEGNSSDINVEEMDDTPSWPRGNQSDTNVYQNSENNITIETQTSPPREAIQDTFISECRPSDEAGTSAIESVITCRATEQPYVSIEPVATESCTCPDEVVDNVSVTITAIPAPVQKRRDSIEPVVTPDSGDTDIIRGEEEGKVDIKDNEVEKTELESPPIVIEQNTSEIVKEKDDNSTVASEIIVEAKSIEEISLPSETCKEIDVIVPPRSDDDVDKKLEPVSPVVPDQVSEVLVQSPITAQLVQMGEDHVIEHVNSTDGKEFAFAVSISEDKPTDAEATSNCVVTITQSTEPKKDETTVICEPSVSSTNESSSIIVTSNEIVNETKEETLVSNVSDESTKSPIVENVLNILEPAALIEEKKNEEETPMDIDLDGEITTATATSAPNIDSDTI